MKRLGFFGVLLLLAYAMWATLRPLPAIQPTSQINLGITSETAQLTWPESQAAVAILGSSALEAHGDQKPTPMASTAKLITALMLLQKMPLDLGQTGPSYTITAADVEIQKRYVAVNGSIFPVAAGTNMSQYQILEAILIPSANNIADAAAVWAYGSLENYQQKASKFLKSHSINNTTVGTDASGLSPTSQTTAQDLVKIASLAMKEPVIAEIVAKQEAVIVPGSPAAHNYNALLGRDGIVGIKTGTSDEAGGAFAGAAKHKVGGHEVTIISAVLGQPNRPAALSTSRSLLISAQNNFKTSTVASKGTPVATYKAPWGQTRQAILINDLSTSYWQGEKLRPVFKLTSVSPGQKSAGKLELGATSAAQATSTKVELNQPFTSPSLWWRLTHPLSF